MVALGDGDRGVAAVGFEVDAAGSGDHIGIGVLELDAFDGYGGIRVDRLR
jgi:hypothetical protein